MAGVGLGIKTAKSTTRSPAVQFWGDSIPYGVHNETFAGPRQPMYLNGQSAGVPKQFTFVGTQSFSGNGGGLAANPQCDCYPGDTLVNLNTLYGGANQFSPQVAIIWGGTNDLNPAVGNFTPAQTATNLSTFMDSVWGGNNKYPWFQIVVCNVLRRYPPDDPTINANVVLYNALVPGVIASKSYSAHVVLCDVYNSVSQANYYTDGIHLLDAGSTQLAVPIANALNGALLACY